MFYWGFVFGALFIVIGFVISDMVVKPEWYCEVGQSDSIRVCFRTESERIEYTKGNQCVSFNQKQE